MMTQSILLHVSFEIFPTLDFAVVHFECWNVFPLLYLHTQKFHLYAGHLA